LIDRFETLSGRTIYPLISLRSVIEVFTGKVMVYEASGRVPTTQLSNTSSIWQLWNQVAERLIAL